MSKDDQVLLSVAEMYRADAEAIAAGISGETLMAAAGTGIAEAIQARWTPRPTLVCCGPGNNGGDGFVVARLLQEAGWPVRLALLGNREQLKGEAAIHAARWPGEALPLAAELVDADCDILVDALFGAGLSRALEGTPRDVILAANQKGCPIVAVDVPSGLSGDSGVGLGDCVAQAALTVTFFRKKPGHMLLPGRSYCGEVEVVDIGTPAACLTDLDAQCWQNDPCLWKSDLPVRGLADHKYRFGHAVILGGARMTGAARLASRAALRVGAGLVTLACPSESFPIYAQSSLSVITLPLETDSDFGALLDDPRHNAVLLGPGLGVTDETRGIVTETLSCDKAVVLDADALTVFRDNPQDLYGALDERCVLTPHDGEFGRIFPDLSDTNKLERVRAAAQRCGAVVLLKGADTVIAAPDGRAVINANAPPDLATAGAGDVLAGLIVGLLAQGVTPFEAAAAAAWLHGDTAQRLGRGLIAEDLPDALPETLQGLR